METYHFTNDEKFSQAQKRVKSIKGFYIHATFFVAINAIIILGCAYENIQSLVTLEPYMTAFYWGIGLLAHGLSVFNQDFILGSKWEEKEIKKILNK